MDWDDKKVIDHRNDIINQLKKYSLSDKKWIIKSFWKGIIDSSSLDDKTEITQKLPPKFINDQKGMILYLSSKLYFLIIYKNLKRHKISSKKFINKFILV